MRNSAVFTAFLILISWTFLVSTNKIPLHKLSARKVEPKGYICTLTVFTAEEVENVRTEMCRRINDGDKTGITSRYPQDYKPPPGQFTLKSDIYFRFPILSKGQIYSGTQKVGNKFVVTDKDCKLAGLIRQFKVTPRRRRPCSLLGCHPSKVDSFKACKVLKESDLKKQGTGAGDDSNKRASPDTGVAEGAVGAGASRKKSRVGLDANAEEQVLEAGAGGTGAGGTEAGGAGAGGAGAGGAGAGSAGAGGAGAGGAGAGGAGAGGAGAGGAGAGGAGAGGAGAGVGVGA